MNSGVNHDLSVKPAPLTQADLQTLKSEGIVLKAEYFSRDEIPQMREAVLRLRVTAPPHNNDARKWVLTSPSDALKKRLLRDDDYGDLLYLSEIPIRSGFKAFAADCFDAEVQLGLILSIESPRSDKPITPWHTDANSTPQNIYPPDYFTLKFFIYLNDIEPSNGAFSYIRGTNRLVSTIREGIFQQQIPYCNLYDIPDIERALRMPAVSDYVRRSFSQRDMDAFLEAATLSQDGTRDIGDCYLSGAAGTLLVFDDRGVHRGGVPQSSERSILRYNYLPKKYWHRQTSRPRHMFETLCKSFLPGRLAAHW